MRFALPIVFIALATSVASLADFAQEQAHFREHSANLRQLREDGALVFGARCSDKGLVVLAASSLEAARAMMDRDPRLGRRK
jgi:uncharacterized protein YciI